MKKTSLYICLPLIILLFSAAPLAAADGEAPGAARYFGPDRTLIIQGPECPAGQNYLYLGVLVLRYYPTPPNSENSESYTNTFVHEAKDTWFIPQAQMQDNQYLLPYDTAKDYFPRLFADYQDNKTYKFLARHLFRMPDGRDIPGGDLQLFYTTKVKPVLTVSQTANQYPTPQITLSGTVSHLENKSVTVSAEMDGVTKSTVITNTQTAQAWSLSWNIVSDSIDDGVYSNIVITANDGSGGISTAVYTGDITVNTLFDSYLYDGLNRLYQIDEASGDTIIFEYDSNGKLIRRYIAVP